MKSLDHKDPIFTWQINIVGIVGFLSIRYGLKLTLRLCLLPLGGEYGTYKRIPYTWVYIACVYTVHQLVSGLYNQWVGRSESFLSVASDEIYWFTFTTI